MLVPLSQQRRVEEAKEGGGSVSVPSAMLSAPPFSRPALVTVAAVSTSPHGPSSSSLSAFSPSSGRSPTTSASAVDDGLSAELGRLRVRDGDVPTVARASTKSPPDRSAPAPAPREPRASRSRSSASESSAASTKGGEVDGNASQPPSALTSSALQVLADRPPSSSTQQRRVYDVTVAKRLVMGALGLPSTRTDEQKAAEREKRAQHRAQRRKALDEGRAAAEHSAAESPVGPPANASAVK